MADRLDKALGARQSRGEKSSAWSKLSSLDPLEGYRLLGGIALDTEPQDARIEIEPHRPQSRNSRISASISSPVMSPGGKDRT